MCTCARIAKGSEQLSLLFILALSRVIWFLLWLQRAFRWELMGNLQ